MCLGSSPAAAISCTFFAGVMFTFETSVITPKGVRLMGTTFSFTLLLGGGLRGVRVVM